MKVQCPNCLMGFEAPDHYLSKKVKCSKCGHKFIALPFNPIIIKTNIPKRGSLFLKFWNNSPVAFRTAFLATLGVVSALAFAYYMMSLPKFLNNKTSSFSQEANMASSSSKSRLAACIVLLNYIGEFQVLTNTRANAASEFNLENEIGLYGFLSVIKISESQLENLYLKVHKLKMSDDEDLQKCYKSLLNAIDAEYSFQKSMLPLIQNPENLQLKAQFQDLSKMAVVNSNFAAASILNLLNSADEGLYEKICYTWNAD